MIVIEVMKVVQLPQPAKKVPGWFIRMNSKMDKQVARIAKQESGQ
jgi:hypothetical protein